MNVRLVKAPDPRGTGKSMPVVVFDYDVNVAVTDEKEKADEVAISALAKLLQVLSFGGAMKGQSQARHSESEIQKLRFTVPVAMPIAET